jgi:hypothetical protein
MRGQVKLSGNGCWSVSSQGSRHVGRYNGSGQSGLSDELMIETMEMEVKPIVVLRLQMHGMEGQRQMVGAQQQWARKLGGNGNQTSAVCHSNVGAR